jgi:hypothetical protein
VIFASKFRRCGRAALLLVAAAALGLAACAPGTARVPSPSDLPAGPILQWAELDFDFETALFAEATSDGRVVVAGRVPGGQFAVRVTEDGTEWTALPVPDGIVPLAADANGDRWVLAGAPPGPHNSDAEIFGDVFVSDDGGESWIEATLDSMPGAQLPEYASRSMRVVDVLTSGRQIVVAVLSFSTFDLVSLLADRDRIPDGMFVAHWTLDDDEESVVVALRHRENDRGVPGETEFSVAYEKLALRPGQIDAIERDRSDARIHLFTGERATLAHMAESDGSDAVGRWTADGFIVLTDDWSHLEPQPQAPPGPVTDGVILVVTTERPSKLMSLDGREWHAESLVEYSDGMSREISALDETGIVWSAWSEGSGRGKVRITRESAGQLPVAAEFERLRISDRLAAGPAGLAAVVSPSMPGGWSYVEAGRVAKDGYELRYDEPPGGVTLWDLGKDTAVYVFGSRLFDGPDTPVGAHQQGDGLSYQLTFDELETSDVLVEFDAFDLQSVFGRCWWTSRRAGVFVQRSTARQAWAPGIFPEFWPWIGWSADGVDWGWEAIPDAFDTCDVSADIGLAVGTDYVVAMLQPRAPSRRANAGGRDDPDVNSPAPPRLFVARVP